MGSLRPVEEAYPDTRREREQWALCVLLRTRREREQWAVCVLLRRLSLTLAQRKKWALCVLLSVEELASGGRGFL